MKNKVTIKDVAREANVSVATVSYVINNREDQKISPETKKKVLHTINLLNYTPNRAAKSLVTKKHQTVALYYHKHESFLKNAEQFYLIDSLSAYLHSKEYHLVCLNEQFIEKYDMADVIVTSDVSKEEFHQIGNANFSPLITLDSFIDDPLFFQVNSDYLHMRHIAENFFKGEPFTFVSIPIHNIERREHLLQVFSDVLFVNRLEDIQTIPSGNILIVDQTLNEILMDAKQKLYLPNISEEKFNHLFQAIEWAMQRQEMDNHNILV